MRHVNLQVRVTEEVKDGLRIRAAVLKTNMAALVQKALVDAGYADVQLPHERNAAVQRAAVKGLAVEEPGSARG